MSVNQNDLKDKIRSSVSIVEVISQYVQLRKSGRSYKGLCPFHQEDTPSFNVNPQEGLYHCFGCKAGGDIFTFVMQMEGLTFSEALEQLAHRAGVTLPDEQGRPIANERTLLYEVNKLAAQFYTRCLLSNKGQMGQAYLRKRGIESNTVRMYNIGYAPASWDFLTKEMVSTGKAEPAVKAGLIVEKSPGSYYDLLRERIIFPITDVAGRVLAFGGRSFGDVQPKYLNSPESQLFSKRRQLYGLSQARKHIQQTKRVILVEGFFDCLTLYQNGIKNVLATCGTALTTEHMQQIRNMARELYICFDADTAGRSGVSRSMSLADNSGLMMRVVMLPSGEDPDSFVRREGGASFLGLLEKALPYRDFMLEDAMRSFDLRNVQGRMAAAKAVIPILQKISSRLERDVYIQRVAARLELPLESLAAEVAEARHTNREIRNTSKDLQSRPKRVVLGPRQLAERELLRCLVQDRTAIPQVVAQLGEAPFTNETYNVVFRVLAADQSLATALENMKGEDDIAVLTQLVEQTDSPLTYQVCLDKLRIEQLREELGVIEEGLATLVHQDPTRYMLQWRQSLLAFWRWRRSAQQVTDNGKAG